MMADGGAALLPDLIVSRETIARLQALTDMLSKWNKAVNLVSKTTIEQAWHRHILDSAQIFQYGRGASHWADIGSGGGFPGLVVAILADELAPNMRVTLVESDQRKAAFLRTTANALGLKTFVLTDRAEAISSLSADILSARALAPLSVLCGIAKRHLADGGAGVFLKGKTSAAEVVEAKKDWQFDYDTHPSATDPLAVILVLKGIAHV